VAASNVANASTPGAAAAGTVQQAAADGTLGVRIQAPPMNDALIGGTDLLADTLNALVAQRSFMANLTVLRAEQEMTSSLVDLKR
jgi:flagellar basal body rod protein FlgC